MKDQNAPAVEKTQRRKYCRANTNDATYTTAKIENEFWKKNKHYKFAFASVLIALLFGTIGFGYYFFNSKNAAASERKSIAVLPLKPINSANRDEIYEIGIADSLIQRLGSIKSFVVRPLSAVRRYADPEQDPLAVGKEQQVDYVLASNYQIAGGKIRITCEAFKRRK